CSDSRRLDFASSPRTCWLTADCVTKLRSAACEKLRVSTRSQKILSVSICTAVIRILQNCLQYFSFYLISPAGYTSGRVQRAVPNMLYDPQLTLREARELYFEINDFKGGGYDEAWVKMKAGPVPVWFPNTKGRVRAVKYHDLHHVLTEYPTTWRGEAEIGAWEVATGCAGHYPAWLLNLEAFAIGLVINPRGVFRAFVRGRRSGNLYRR